MDAVRKVALCSTNPAKVAAATTVCKKLFSSAPLETVSMSGLPDQPIGRSETKTCALTRAKHALNLTGADFGIGLESGVDLEGWLINCVAVVSKKGRESIVWGLSFELPREAAERIILKKEEMGPVMDEIFAKHGSSKSHGGAVGQLTNGIVTRADIWESPLGCAFIPFIHAELYPSSL